MRHRVPRPGNHRWRAVAVVKPIPEGRSFRLGSRGSALARWQATHVEDRLASAHADLSVTIDFIRTTGDRVTDVPLARIGDKGLFTKEIDLAVLDGRVDAAVHSLKDLPTVLGPGLALAAILEREDPRDALIPAPGRPATLAKLPAGACVGTSSLRRRSQLLASRPDLRVDDLRGNLDTRLGRLADGDYDAAVVAFAGVRRLEREDAVGEVLDAPDWLPAAGQGAVALVVRDDDSSARELLAPLDHDGTRSATTAERAFLRALEGGCQIPIGALARPRDGGLLLHGFVGSLDGRQLLRAQLVGEADRPAALGQSLANRLREQGAGAILRDIRDLDPLALPGASPP